MPIVEVDQNSPDWLKMRVGLVTASRVCDVLAVLKRGGESAARRNYKFEKVQEILTGLAAEAYVTPAMEFGIENEPLARTAYEMANEVEVVTGGIAFHDKIERFAASPDGRLGDDGLLEIKVPTTMTHLTIRITNEVPVEWVAQMQAQMACTGRKWCDFLSYDPRLPKTHKIYIRRFERDEAFIEGMEKEVVKFLAEVDEMLVQLGEKPREAAQVSG